jgi:transcriptional regulator with XRE-family HTH domain
MTPAEIKTWRQEMNFSQRAAAAALGISLRSYQALERGRGWESGAPVKIDDRTALACAAIRAGIPPEGENHLGD